MNRTKRLVVVAGLGTALAGGLVVPVAAWAAEPTPASSSTASGPTTGTTTGDGRRGGHGGHGDRGQKAAELAELLGVDEAKVTAALEEIRGARGTGKDFQPGDRTAMAEALAAELGVSADKVTAALDTLRQKRTAAAETALTERLKTAVTAGTITQAEADAVLKAHRAGLLGGGPRGGGKAADTATATE
ncbi:hypothetical protein [Planomonospora sp. ID82291]|uniref:hypothetical protein n=1 Tax=Planomonospora sp. ID82291 TaxID=2738136 RepID=UPI0018C391AD|nr:hypothetical protein [Planomonospora sp. ID82291]MBG0814220.1 hypothetical protein [Planomonospora sp. ID82291]